ncbi:helix-turn-helix domain-containing protein [Vagococcus fluvialis]|uniref:AraC family transcriptional regulator n=1 Tax=Vagococcus fluvialis TaxID=2738 RepID=UPI003D10ABB5
MNSEILKLLRKNNSPRNWGELGLEMKPKIATYIGKEPVYEFFNTLDDSLEINLHSIAISVQPVDSEIPYHMHDYVELIIPLMGDCVVTTKNEIINVAQNDIMVMGNKTIHHVEKINNEGIVINLSLKDSAFSLNDVNFIRLDSNRQNISAMLFSLLSYEELGENNYNLFKTESEPKISETIYDILEEYYYPDSQTNQIIRFQLLTLFSRLIRVASNNSLPIMKTKHSSSNLLSLLLYIEKNYADISLDKMAKHFGFNPNYLSGYLKKQTGLTFIKLVHLQRVNSAAEYLTYTNAPIEQIAIKVGYENPSYFYKIFRKNLKVSPTEYREKYRTHKILSNLKDSYLSTEGDAYTNL